MGAVATACVAAPLMEGDPPAYLRIALLPQVSVADKPPPLLVLDEAELRQFDGTASVQVLEGHEYLYEWSSVPGEYRSVVTEPREAFQPDTPDGLRGRLRPGLATGLVEVELFGGGKPLARVFVEVRSRKLGYRSEYRWMLRDIAERILTELIMDRFAASGSTFAPTARGDAVTLYQRFAFLRALITGETFQAALREVLGRPHVAWADTHEQASPAQGMKSSSRTLRQIGGPGRRVAWIDGPAASLPERLDRRRTEATHDTVPNRFVRFAFERWRQVISDIDDGLARANPSPAVVRGRQEVSEVLELIDESLNEGLFKEVGALSHFPAENQVLHQGKVIEMSSRPTSSSNSRRNCPGKGKSRDFRRGNATSHLYEYWVFIQLAKIVAELVGQEFDITPLIKAGTDGLNVSLQIGKETVLSGEVDRLGNALELCFNRTFSVGQLSGSWTRAMRPDYSLFIGPASSESAGFAPILVHFDAKYRVAFLEDLFGAGNERADRSGESGGG